MVRNRPDLDTKEIVRRWLDGESAFSIAVAFETTIGTIQHRIRQAKKATPDLPWDQRKVKPQPSPTKEFVEMTDGTPGESVLKSGSVVRGRRFKKR